MKGDHKSAHLVYKKRILFNLQSPSVAAEGRTYIVLEDMRGTGSASRSSHRNGTAVDQKNSTTLSKYGTFRSYHSHGDRLKYFTLANHFPRDNPICV